MIYKLAKQAANENCDETIIAEIGSYLGASSCFLAAGIENSGSPGKIYCIDTWENDAMSEDKRDTMIEFHHNTTKLASFIVPFRGLSTAVVSDIAQQVQQLDLLFIDGDHSYEGCLSDWKAYSPLLKKNSIVIFHDVGWAEGVKKVVEDEVLSLVGEKGRLPNMWWGWIV